MKKVLLGLYLFLILNGLLALGLPMIGITVSVALFIIVSLILSLLTLYAWMSYIRLLAIKSNAVIHGRGHPISTWTFSNIDLLNQNQELIQNKFLTSAELISNLGSTETVEKINNLDSNDVIGGALQKIKAEMQKIRDIDEQREWIAQGLARFGEVLRNKLEVKAYAGQIISTLATYLKVCQGALYIEYQDAESGRYLELVASYAHDRERSGTRIFEGQGQVGQCMIDEELIFIMDVPNNYVKINSGLGAALPKAITIVPLVFKQKFYGAIELASFESLQPHQIEFLKTVCENIASEISALKNVEHARTLLDEAERSQQELKGYLSGIDNTIASAEFGLDGKLRNANEIFLKVSGYTKQELQGKNHTFLMGEDQAIKMMWENLLLGKFFSGEFRMKDKAGKELWLNGTFNPITINGNVPERIMMFAQFTTQEKEKLSDLTAMVHALKATLPVIEFNHDFVCKVANEKALKLFGLSRLQLKSKTIFDFVAPCYHDSWNDLRTKILGGDFSNIVIPFFSDSRVLHYEVSTSVSRNPDGEITKIIFLLIKEASDRTHHLAAS